MIKKITLIVTSLLIFVGATSYFYLPNYAITLVKQYDPYTFERVLEDDTMRVNYGIYDKDAPDDYGFDQFEEVSYTSLLDGNRLSAWFVPATVPTEKTLLIVHGRWSNRLKTMKYLEIIKRYQLDTLYNVMLPDLRNSGKSEPGETMMGYEFAEDIASSAIWLSDNKEQSEIILFGFSMGGMATATLLNRPDLMSEIQNKGISFSRVILDSPVANVEEILMRGGKAAGLPELIVQKTINLLNDEYDGFLSKMKFSTLLAEVDMPVLILQGTNDSSQPLEILEGELGPLENEYVSLHIFEDAKHVQLYQVEPHKDRYSQLIRDFIVSQ